MASYRYRAKIPSEQLNIPLNQEADIYILSKPQAQDLDKELFIADFCDDHFTNDYYLDILDKALLVTCPTVSMQQRIKTLGREATVIPDPYEYPLEAPHCNGERLLWYGHGSNLYSIVKWLKTFKNVRIVSNVENTILWSHQTMLREFKLADIVLMPATKDYKSPNRTIEAIRQGCFVVAEPHLSIQDFPIYIGNLEEGVIWARTHQQQANQMILEAQQYIEARYSPQTVASAWKPILEHASILAAAKLNGLTG
jgi:hypothetical protein